MYVTGCFVSVADLEPRDEGTIGMGGLAALAGDAGEDTTADAPGSGGSGGTTPDSGAAGSGGGAGADAELGVCYGTVYCNSYDEISPGCASEIGTVGEPGRSTIVSEAIDLNCDATPASVPDGVQLLQIGPGTGESVGPAFAGVDNAWPDSLKESYTRFCLRVVATAESGYPELFMSFRSNGATQGNQLNLASDSTPSLQLQCSDGLQRTSALFDINAAQTYEVTIRFDEENGADFKLEAWIDKSTQEPPDLTVDCFGSNPTADGVAFGYPTYLWAAKLAEIHVDAVRTYAQAPGASVGCAFGGGT